MIQVPFDAIDKAALDNLVTNAVQEGKTIEYKVELPKGNEAAIKEFLADVSSFANSSGGDIIYGVREKREAGKKTGLPEAVVGLAGVVGPDDEVRRLQSIVRDGLEPRLSVQIKHVGGFPNGPAIVVRVPKSWFSPHMVSKGASRFFSRTSAGKFPLDVHEIRWAFAQSEQLEDRIRSWRDARLMKILAGDTPVPVDGEAKVVLHIVPISTHERGTTNRGDAGTLQRADFRPMVSHGGGFGVRRNIDGACAYESQGDAVLCWDYCQVFRDGRIEAVDGDLLHSSRTPKQVEMGAVERNVVTAVVRYCGLLTKNGIDAPFVVLLALTNVRGYEMLIDQFTRIRRGPSPIDRDVLVLPEVLIEQEQDIPAAMKPMGDALWNAVGWDKSNNYDEQGRWSPK